MADGTRRVTRLLRQWSEEWSWVARTQRAITRAAEDARVAMARHERRLAERAPRRVFCVLHEPPDVGGTSVLATERVRSYNLAEDTIAYYVIPAAEAPSEVEWIAGVPVLRCSPLDLQVLVDRHAPTLIEYHHTQGWPLSILEISSRAERHLYLHDSALWCAATHSFDGRAACDRPAVDRCHRCVGIEAADYEARRAYLATVLPQLTAIHANSEYTRHHAQLQLGVSVLHWQPQLPPLVPRFSGRKVGYFGGFAPVKGVQVLLEAAVHMPETQFLFWCDKPAPEFFQGRLLRGIDNVLFMGAYERAELPMLVNLVDLAVVPSLNESYGLVARELRSLGMPVVATQVGGLDGEVVAGDAAALVAALRGRLAELR
jgi:glycosyltransferase involved in cell wall biosynthesis